jgi:hypothetical protein
VTTGFVLTSQPISVQVAQRMRKVIIESSSRGRSAARAMPAHWARCLAHLPRAGRASLTLPVTGGR